MAGLVNSLNLDLEPAQAVAGGHVSDMSDSADELGEGGGGVLVSTPQSVFSAHWAELSENLSEGAKRALEEHLGRTSADASASEAGALSTARSAVSSSALTSNSALSAITHNTNTRPDSPIESINVAHAHHDARLRELERAGIPVSARSALTDDDYGEGEGEGPLSARSAASPSQSDTEAEAGDTTSVSAGNTGGTTGGTQLTSKTNFDYSKLDYWESRFEGEDEYDWLLTFAQVSAQVLPLLQPYGKRAKILLVGVGNSSFSADLYDAGYTHLVNMDYSSVVIENMRAKHAAQRPLMQWEVADMTTMDLTLQQHAPFDVVIDKAALDALMVDEGSVWDPMDSVVWDVDKTCKCVRAMFAAQTRTQTSRAVTPTAAQGGEAPSMEALAAMAAASASADAPAPPALPGLYLMISFMQPHFRTKYLMGTHADRAEGLREETHEATSAYAAALGYSARYDWDIRWETVQMKTGSFEHFLYVVETGKKSE